MIRSRFRILALDVDGTLLDRFGALRTTTADAVARAARAGIRPILCTGRRYRRARPIAELLGLDAPIVCNSGAIVKSPADHGTLWRADFEPTLADALLDLFHAHDQLIVAFNDRRPDQADFRVSRFPSGRPLFDDYVDRNRAHAEAAADWTAEPLFHMCAIGSRDDMLAFERIVLDACSDQVRTFVQRSPQYKGTMCEVVRRDAGKWAAVLHVAELWGVDPEEICAVGDDVNDVSMIEGAGLGVAMGHAPPDVLAVADHVTGDHDGDGVAMLIERLLAGGVGPGRAVPEDSS
ncbi:MAG: HAD family hydrolase [Paludisphaera borealis]|uniref:HAD family hydrolase n=1 Tax=Paludisphaera borealis TaxID=1387353 RepID=UPI002841ABEC|nr:HAD family hydrolase [Paludisphaera borealis]MDR3619996.1 HAD family hydrolase [Paludisphaera borealis]